MHFVHDITIDFLTGQPYLTVLVFILFLLMAYWLYRRTNPPLGRGWKIILIVLRIIALTALFLALFEPVISYRRQYDRKPRLTVLIDRSGSMDITEANSSRWEQVERFINSDDFEDFAGHFDLNRLFFSDQPSDEINKLDLQKTALGEILKTQAAEELGRRAENWLLISDGISNSGVSPVTVASELKTPVFTLGVGRSISERDVAVENLDYNRVVFAGKPTELKAEIAWQGMNGEKAEIEVKSGDKIMTTEEVILTAGNLRDEVVLKFTPDKTGQQAFGINIKPLADEISVDNNHRSFSMTVLKSKKKVLLVAENPDWEYAFLKRFLDGLESVELEPVLFKKEGGFLFGGVPTRSEELNKYDLLVFYDIVPDKLKSRRDIIGTFLRDKGGSLLVFLGANYLKDSPPRWLDDFLPFAAVSRRAKPLYFKYNGLPMENYLFHPAVHLSDNRRGIREVWQNLPHFEALVPTDSIMPDAEILVTANIGMGEENPPLIGVRTFGRGKVLTTAAMPFWHWAFYGYGLGGDDRLYRKFFDGLVNWLTISEDTDPVQITPDKNIYTRGEKIGFSAQVFDLGFRAITGASGYIALIRDGTVDSLVAQLVEIGEGAYRADFELVPAGRYRYYGAVEKDNKKMKEASGQLIVESYSVEEFRRKSDFETLAGIARLTGGHYSHLENADSLLRRIDTTRIQISTQNEIALWNKIWLLILFILALGAEWSIRKRLQLI